MLPDIGSAVGNGSLDSYLIPERTAEVMAPIRQNAGSAALMAPIQVNDGVPRDRVRTVDYGFSAS